MAGKVIPYSVSITASGGTVSSNISGFNPIINPGGFIYQIFVKATTTTTIFDFYITSPSSNVVYHKKNITGQLNDTNIKLPVQGVYTLTVANSTVDEAFTIEIGFKEERV